MYFFLVMHEYDVKQHRLCGLMVPKLRGGWDTEQMEGERVVEVILLICELLVFVD